MKSSFWFCSSQREYLNLEEGGGNTLLLPRNEQHIFRRKIIYYSVLFIEILLATGIAYAFESIVRSPLCNQMFRCGNHFPPLPLYSFIKYLYFFKKSKGCTWSWAGGRKHCNINNPTGPHCPWCTDTPYQWTKEFVPILLMVITYIFLIFAWRNLLQPKLKLQGRLLLVIAIGVIFRVTIMLSSYFIFAIFVGLVFKSQSNYPYFF